MSPLLRSGALLLGLLLAVVVAALWVRWLHHRLAVLPAWPTGVRRVVAVLLGAGPLLFALSWLWSHELDPTPVRPLLWVGFTWVAVALYLTLGVAALTLASALVGLPLRLLRRDPAPLRRRLHRLLVPVVVLATAGAVAWGSWQASQPRLAPITLTSADVPPGWDGARIALVTDLHVGPLRGAAYTREVVDLVNAARPDLVVLGGDLADGRERWNGVALDPLADLQAPQGALAVSGNHEFLSGDADAWLAHWEALGIVVLRNQHVTLARSGSSITVAGLQDHDGTGADAPDPAAALAGVDPAGFTVLAVHEPRQVVAGRGVDLQLSGHTHGGQLWPFGYLVALQQPTLAGLDVVDGVPVVTSRGVGAWGPQVRVGAPPEVVVVTLRRP